MPRLHRDVERRDRLVQHDHSRRERQRPGDADALALAAGELVRIARGMLGVEPRPLEELGNPRGRSAAPASRSAQRLGDDAAPTRMRGFSEA